MGDGRTARRELDGVARELVGRNVLVDLQQVGVAVQMVEVLQQGEVHAGLRILVGLVHGQPCRQVDGQLLVADGQLERRLVAGGQPVDVLLLHLFHAAAESDLAAQVVVLAMAMEVVAEQGRLHLDAVHEDDAGLGVGIGLQLVVRLRLDALPILHEVHVGFLGFLLERVHASSCFCGC